MDYSKLKAPRHRVILRVNESDRRALYQKNIRRADGSEVTLYINVPPDANEDRRSQIFVNVATVMAVGEGVENIEVGDTAIIDYLIDNDPSFTLGFDGNDKYISVRALTTYFEKDQWNYADRRNPKSTDRRTYKAGQPKHITDVLAVLRDGVIHAVAPYVFLEHRTLGKKKTASGIEYSDYTPVDKTFVLSISKTSSEKYGVNAGDEICIKHYDIFDVKFNNLTFSVMNDEDFLVKYNS